jgi:hypothetical protein
MASSVINSDDGVISGTSGLKSSGGDDGVLVFQSKGTETARINTDKQIVAAAGTASLPALTTTGDVNTGIFFPAADTIAFAEGGAEAMRIDSSGNVFVGATSGNAKLVVDSDSLTLPVFRVNSTGSSSHQRCVSAQMPNRAPNDTTSYFFNGGDSSATRAVIYSNGGLANFSGNNVNLSDRREKTNFAPAKNYLDVICNILVQTFNYIDQSDDDPGLTLGVVAQDVQEVAPELVMESNWGTEEEPKMRLSIYQTDLQYALMKCIQELSAKNDALEARIAALEQA